MNDSVNRYEELAKAYKELQQENEEEYQKLVKVEQVLTSGTEIAKVGGKSIYAPGGGGSVNVIDGLTSESATDALSANQGRVLNGKIGTLSNLDTTAKSDVVSAINEVKGKIITDSAAETSATIASLTPNVFHQWGEVAALTITALGSGATGKVTEYMIEFQSGSTPTVLSLPNGIKWANGDDPTQDIKANKTYQISIVNNLGVYAEF
jgi:uncharacterized protein YdbL (DUF1318 family)